MSLSLKAHHPNLPNDVTLEVTMIADTITVGRGEDNDLVLPDPDRHLSKQHCVVERSGDSFVVRDMSTNGTFLNYQDDRLEAAPTPLNTGDVILVGEFELVVSIREVPADAAATNPAPDLLGPSNNDKACFELDPLAASHDDDSAFLDALLSEPASVAQPVITDPVDALLQDEPQMGASAPDHTPAAQDHFVPPRAMNAVIPDDWDDNMTSPSAEEPPREDPERTPLLEQTPDPTPLPATQLKTADADTAVQAFVAGLGVTGLQITPEQTEEVMGRMGRMMAAMIAGMREIMMTRAALKSEMRVTRTMIEPDQNNPLKFSVSVEQAIEAMLKPAGRGYQDPESAAAEVLHDIKTHEVATMTGTQAALTDLLAQLAPEQVSARIEKRSGFLGNRKAQLWGAYVRHHSELVRQTEDDFQSTFGKAFSRAYEQQITKL
ncbi:type VI secretion system-associated FHA domain protein TagH [uncultured Tateyamaria sp.]|uniref:type VI secretion system-associated FHA domain protein TagH n=1 Tax=uncultured Tateyamaria sp. TaxID=455651 RepID=UPI00262127ED|nr:type VI secretion system-associated FHA domain protein TagH [uncultured Tateyamaria sp.]